MYDEQLTATMSPITDTILAASRGAYFGKQEPDVTAHYQQDRHDLLSPACKAQERLSRRQSGWLIHYWHRG